jgi:sensor c-di-GMP phosphodiesterase-like protein
VVPPRRNLLVAIAAGVALAGPPVVLLNLWLQDLVARHHQEEIEHVARRTIAVAEARISRVIAALDGLAARGVDSCSAAHVEALRQTMFATVPAKEFSILAADGGTLCTDLGSPAGHRRVMSSEPLTRGGDTLLEVIQLGDQPGMWVRIRRLGIGAGGGLAALIPTELLSASTSSLGEPLKIRIRVSTREGTILGDAGAAPAAAQDTDDHLVSRFASESMALDVTVLRPRNAASESQENLRTMATVVSGIVAILILGIALLLPRRRLKNPVEELERAMKAGEFVPYYQPIVDIRSGRLRGAEVLVRWRRADGTYALPAMFIPLAESSGLIVEMTRALMRRVCQEVGPAVSQRPQLKIGFNLTARHFADEQIVSDVRKIFGNSQMRLSQVVLEVTERQPLDNLTETRRVVAALQGLGVRIAIDDVGTGHSGLSYMLKLGADIIKIDKIFIDSIGTDRHSHTIIETLIDLAQNMRMDIIAEGVETFEQVVALRDLGIRAAQGFVFAPPLPGSSFLQLVETIEPLKPSVEPADTRAEGKSASRAA